jgi:uncharacterized membrane protein YqjE
MSPSPRGGLGVSLLRLAGTLVAILQTRLELLVTELEEEKLRLGGVLLYAVAAFFFVGFGVVLLAAFFTVLFWESHRELVLGVCSAVFLTIGIIAAAAMLRNARAGSRLFAASLSELARDRHALANNDEPPAN